MQQLREATIKHEATVQTLNNQIHSLQKQLLESERKVPTAVAALFWWSVRRVVDRGSCCLSLQGQRGVLRPAAEGAATGEGISREAELVIAGLREELSQVRCSIALKLTRTHTHSCLTLCLQEREHLAHYRVIADDREKAMKELQEVRCFQGLEGKL